MENLSVFIFRCRNGFNRRDEALKHYKTHFRNPQTTFQIQVTQVSSLWIKSCYVYLYFVMSCEAALFNSQL